MADCGIQYCYVRGDSMPDSDCINPAPEQGPRPPEGDWLGTPFLKFKREGPFAICTLDRPEARNAMTGAMYFGIRYAIGRVNEEPNLAGLLITGDPIRSLAR
jgi:hypothetical protein